MKAARSQCISALHLSIVLGRDSRSLVCGSFMWTGARQQAQPLESAGHADTLSRWSAYSSMTIDPNDDCTFWYSTEPETNGRVQLAHENRLLQTTEVPLTLEGFN
ncbi:MAG: hypothetical protein ACR2IB_10980 [Pyrinomonadaceae bacterium]